MAALSWSAVRSKADRINLITCIPIQDGVAVTCPVRRAEYEGISASRCHRSGRHRRRRRSACHRGRRSACHRRRRPSACHRRRLHVGAVRVPVCHRRHRRISMSSPHRRSACQRSPMPLRTLGLASPVSESFWEEPVRFSILPSLSPAAPLAFGLSSVLDYHLPQHQQFSKRITHCIQSGDTAERQIVSAGS